MYYKINRIDYYTVINTPFIKGLALYSITAVLDTINFGPSHKCDHTTRKIVI